MKKLIIIFILFLTTFSYSQEISIQNHKYYINGQQISTRDVREKLGFNPEASKLFKQGISKSSTGGLFLGLGIAICTGDLVKGLVSDEKYPGVATWVGIGSMALSVPILIGTGAKKRKAIEIYNNGLKNTGENETDYQLNIISNQNGYGIQLRF
jgi:hypothetical protein